jgi:hypothetical protein
MITNIVLLIFDCHVYYCLGGILLLVLLAGMQRRIEERRKKRKKKCSCLGFHHLASIL